MTQNEPNSFPVLKNDRILKVLKGETPDKLPVWIMRQAGRHMEEFREFRRLHSFFDICQQPELASEVTMMPIRRYDLDAAIIFSDILVIPQALGLDILMEAGVGPVISNPVTVDTLDTLEVSGAVDRLQYVGDAITLTRQKLEGKVPLLGFAGAPWTLMGYMIEGGGSKTLSKAKKWLYKHPKESHLLLSLLTDIIVDYLVMQIKAGAQAVQVFDSSAEHLNETLFDTFCRPYLTRIPSEVSRKLAELGLGETPTILFAKGAHYALAAQKGYGYAAVGVDWTVSPKAAREALGRETVIQGNLDPCALYAAPEDLKRCVKEMVAGFGTKNYVVNLGHGIYPDMEGSAVDAFIEAVHSIPME